MACTRVRRKFMGVIFTGSAGGGHLGAYQAGRVEGRYAFSAKALDEMEADRIAEQDVVESIVNAVAIYKTIRSRSPRRSHAHEKL